MAATALSGAPSTLWALATGGDPGEATWAAGAMWIPADSSRLALFASAAVVHGAVSTWWAAVAGLVLPRRNTGLAAVGLSAAIGVLDLGLIAPRWFPEVAALAFWPQMADHLMWGACLGLTLAWRTRALHRQDSPAGRRPG